MIPQLLRDDVSSWVFREVSLAPQGGARWALLDLVALAAAAGGAALLRGRGAARGGRGGRGDGRRDETLPEVVLVVVVPGAGANKAQTKAPLPTHNTRKIYMHADAHTYT